MKHNWTYKKLGEVCDVINGLWTGKKEPFINVAVIRNTNFSKDCKLKLDNVAYIEVEAKQFASRKLQYGDIIIEKSGGSEKQPVGRPILFDITEGDYSFSNFTTTMRIKSDNVINPKFLHNCLYAYYLNGATAKMQSKTTGLHNLDMKAFLNLTIPLPPLAIQSRIVSELDLLQSIIDKQKAQLKELDTLAQSIFYDMFGDPVENEKGWEVKKLGEITVKYSDGPFGSNLKSEHYQQTGVRVIRLQNIGVNTFIDLDQAYISEDHYGTLSKYSCYPGDIVIGTLGEPNLRACLIPNTIQKAINKADCVLCRVRKDIISNTFLCMVLNEKGFVDTQCQSFSHGQTRTRISAGQLKKSLIPIPPLSLQQSFAAKIESIEKQKAAISKSIAETEKLFDYTMDKYFG